MADGLFDLIRELKQCPKLDKQHSLLKEIVSDYIQRGNVHKFSGRQEFDQNFEKTK